MEGRSESVARAEAQLVGLGRSVSLAGRPSRGGGAGLTAFSESDRHQRSDLNCVAVDISTQIKHT